MPEGWILGVRILTDVKVTYCWLYGSPRPPCNRHQVVPPHTQSRSEDSPPTIIRVKKVHLLHGTESFLKEILSQSENSPNFMKREDSLLHLQEPANCPSLKPDQSSPCPQRTSRRSTLILFSFIRLRLPSDLRSWFPTKTLHATLLFAMRVTRPVYLYSWLDHPNRVKNTWILKAPSLYMEQCSTGVYWFFTARNNVA
jgi:hypothetical protein